MKITHNKIKNTGLIFEILTRTFVNETLTNNKTIIPSIIKKYFKNSELAKEYKLYEIIIKNKNLTESKAQNIINTVLSSHKYINQSKLKSEKYNLIKEIKEHYNINDFFKITTPDYKLLASIYLLFEIERSSKNMKLIEDTIKYKNTIIENLTVNNNNKINNTNPIIQEYRNQDKITRSITQKILISTFNKKYKFLTENQRKTVKHFINSNDNPELLLEYYNKRVYDITKNIVKNINNIESEPIRIKLKEALNYLKPVLKTTHLKDDKIINLLFFDELSDNLKNDN